MTPADLEKLAPIRTWEDYPAPKHVNSIEFHEWAMDQWATYCDGFVVCVDGAKRRLTFRVSTAACYMVRFGDRPTYIGSDFNTARTIYDKAARGEIHDGT